MRGDRLLIDIGIADNGVEDGPLLGGYAVGLELTGVMGGQPPVGGADQKSKGLVQSGCCHFSCSFACGCLYEAVCNMVGET
ncbi:hypothetical protein D3C73_1378920 [compost metagenome]